ncbi:MAG: serine/threonine protein kinase [Lachnospiraceae bacterium]|nr:serine/threonine protein kinase [Lachnospiraceae bacterium]
MLKIGSVIDGKYKVLNEIGHGGMSTVYLAINEKANKPWAIKEVRKSVSRSFDILKQSLILETDMLKKLSHKNLPSIVDVIDSDENFLIVMDYIEGSTLEKLVNENGAYPQEEVVDWAIQLCDVLQYLHERPKPIIYRDMKPSNVMLKSDGSVVLIDFGTAREFKEQNAGDTICLGTQGYAAPEQFGGMGQTDARTDIYCLGATMYHLLTGHNPSEPPYEMYPITKWKPELSSGLEKVILKCTCKNPADRYQSADELMYALKHYRDLETETQLKCRRRLGRFAAALFLCLVSAVCAIGFRVAASEKIRDDYTTLLEMAGRTADMADAGDLYMEAIGLDAARPDAYHAYYNRVVEDGVFDVDEEKILLRINMSAKEYLKVFETNDPLAYADFCYEMGNAYWYYYSHEENRKTRALGWYEPALLEFEGNSERSLEYSRCRLYLEIGNFYKKMIAAQIDGTDEGIYGKYWNSLSELKALNDENPDRELITLRMYYEIMTRVTEYARYFMDDGVTREEITAMFDSIEADMERMQEGAAPAVLEEIEKIRTLRELADKIVRSTYKE